MFLKTELYSNSLFLNVLMLHLYSLQAYKKNQSPRIKKRKKWTSLLPSDHRYMRWTFKGKTNSSVKMNIENYV